MGSWGDLLSLVLTFGLLAGVAFAAVVGARRISEFTNQTKTSLKEKGWNISGEGVSVKTNKRLERSDYIDATQRGMMKVMDAATYGGTAQNAPGAGEGAKPLNRTHSKTSSQTTFFGGEEDKNHDGGGDDRRRGILHRKKH
ncbi:uncharacterized protein STEHIDRAFT_122917 [Stereum hirsutum FP-91666 SS1]|uniref:uncharacterized protein n=1 Tax=Stereum hirsutum (strain FP-91666) TaxID=721885 RepID=UPI000444A63B|nr:uncharacterized protein STEHIDRAFT_122917 [Stereum hirsutum FP-91666 SS1]EIM84994.1 hypothetical protein STEHIDRAFT_122917 [Stereum hirsutum FP-91666 SS1]